ncbi:MAG: RNA methyltransferase, partial [Candidatus Eremiobacteraeota bacterium]|nr:RNA methyltransferase [Candidatus Eremiobacteraeota bacterium]
KIARAAAQQSGRTHVPDIDEPLAFQTLLGTLSGYALALFAWELGGVPLREALRARGDAHSILAIVGPEGGFSTAEAEAAEAAGARRVSLGRRILRTETAGPVILTAVLYEGGEL